MTEYASAIGRGLDRLVALQLPTGEIPGFASPLNEPKPDWVLDPLNFMTALAISALDPIKDVRSKRVVDQGVSYLRGEREPLSLWRYWSRSNERWAFTPPDADDTACCSIAVATRGDRTESNVKVLLSMLDSRGRFRTWLIPQTRTAGLRVWWALRSERSKETKALREALWESTEADPDDADAVVNSNVCRYLGPERAPKTATDWVVSVVTNSDGSGDKWHRSPFALWASVADGIDRGITEFDRLAPVISTHISTRVEGPNPPATAFEQALALAALTKVNGPQEIRRVLVDALCESQRSDGSWTPSVVYHGGPDEVFGWTSEGLITALAVGALAGERPRMTSGLGPQAH